jgi:hypothetical protein
MSSDIKLTVDDIKFHLSNMATRIDHLMTELEALANNRSVGIGAGHEMMVLHSCLRQDSNRLRKMATWEHLDGK